MQQLMLQITQLQGQIAAMRQEAADRAVHAAIGGLCPPTHVAAQENGKLMCNPKPTETAKVK